MVDHTPKKSGVKKGCCGMEQVRSTIEKWYAFLKFPEEYDEFISKALETTDLSAIPDLLPEVAARTLSPEDSTFNLLYALYWLEELSLQYNEAGISFEIFTDTVFDIKLWTENFRKETGRMGLGEIRWITFHLRFILFRLGRLQFEIKALNCDVPKYGLKQGEPILGVHIPGNGSLNYRNCLESFDMARTFFKNTYHYSYRAFTCHSWLLATNLKEILPSNSNILKFQELFDVVSETDGESALKFVFPGMKEKIPVSDYPEDTSLRRNMKEFLLRGGTMQEGLGIIL